MYGSLIEMLETAAGVSALILPLTKASSRCTSISPGAVFPTRCNVSFVCPVYHLSANLPVSNGSLGPAYREPTYTCLCLLVAYSVPKLLAFTLPSINVGP